MKATIVTCFESNEERAAYVAEVFFQRNDETEVYTSDFSHAGKKRRENIPEGFRAVATKPYKKNMSLSRILSHRKFARDVFDELRKNKPDLIWLMAPANFLIVEAERYKKENPDVRLIIDIIDMWPESLPVSLNKDRFPFSVWRDLRSKHLSCADLLVCECDLYQEILKKEYEGEIRTLRWARKRTVPVRKDEIPGDPLSLVYIGSINNIIDISRIYDVVKKIGRNVVLHVIGDGESRDLMLKKMKEVCEVEYHGVVRDEKRKAEIFGNCHAGINVYKEGLYIGLTVKCIDYFEHGLPIINNIKGDTKELIEQYHAGINLDQSNVVEAGRLINMRQNNWSVYSLFEENFSKEIFTERCRAIIGEVTE